MSSSPLNLFTDDPLAFLLLAVALILSIGLHEYAHALAADLQGDRLPRAMGRLTLNPIRHLDPLGTLMIFIAGFGWGKPVEFRPQALSSKRFGAALVALAGPTMNVLLAGAGALAFRASFRSIDALFFIRFLLVFVEINVLLAVFNLIPIPPLDGSRLLTIFLPPSKQKVIFFLDKWGMLILFGIIFLGRGTIFRPVIDFVESTVLNLTGLN
jgi:Zn-dependent protease